MRFPAALFASTSPVRGRRSPGPDVPFATDQDADFSRLTHPLTPADCVFVKNGHF